VSRHFFSPGMSRILKEIAEFSNPAPKDFDPEDIMAEFEASESEVDDDINAGREHYVEVG
jgi:protein AATF/BFR2